MDHSLFPSLPLTGIVALIGSGRCRRLRRQHEAETDASVMGVRLNTISPPNAAMQIPIVVAASPEASLGSRSVVWAPIAGQRLEIVGAGVLAPFPHVPGHVIERQLVRRFCRHRMGSCAIGQELSQAIGNAPASRPAKHPHESLIRTAPARPIPGHCIWVVTTTEGKVVAPMRTATSGIFPF